MERIPFVRRAILAERPVAASLGWTALAVFVPTVLRWVIDRGENGIPFVTYFPAILLATALLGWRYGTLAAVVSAVVANRLLRAQPLLFYVSGTDALLMILFIFACLVIVAAGETMRRLVRQQDEARRREEVLKRELLHRGKNMLSIIHSLATMSARNADPDNFVEAFGSRLTALGRANALLDDAEPGARDIAGLVRSAAEAFSNGDNITFSGPHHELDDRAIVPLSLALHELFTNAIKYGALSVPQGKVTIDWERAGENGDTVRIRWRESGGPKVRAPKRRGLGTMLLQPRYPVTEVDHQFHETGVECVLTIEQSR